jgi:hypothetical protein
MVQNAEEKKRPDDEKYKEYARSANQGSLAWTMVSITTFVLVLLLPPSGQTWERWSDMIAAILIASVVLFATSWYCNDSAAYPRQSRFSFIGTSRSMTTVADICITLACFLFGVGIAILLHALNMDIAFAVFIALFVIVMIVGCIHRFLLLD